MVRYKRKLKASPFTFKPVKLNSSPQKKSDMNWKQAKKAYPKLKPFGDADRDGVKNRFDCKPFDISRQGPSHKKKYLSEEGELRPATIRDRIRDKVHRLTNSPPEISSEDRKKGWHRNQFDPHDIVADEGSEAYEED